MRNVKQLEKDEEGEEEEEEEEEEEKEGEIFKGKMTRMKKKG